MERDRLLALLDDYIECALTEADQHELEKQLLESPAARLQLWAYVQQHALIEKIERERAGDAMARKDSAKILGHITSVSVPRRFLSWPVVGLIAATIALFLAFAWQLGGPREEQRLQAPPGRTEPNNLGDDVSPTVLATWLGGPNADAVAGVGIAPDGTLVVGINMPGGDFASWKPDRLEGTGDAAVLRIAADGKRLLAVARRDGPLDDFRLDGAGNVYLIGGNRCAKLDTTLQTAWSVKTDAANGRVVPGPNGSAFVLSGNTISVVDTKGTMQQRWTILGRRVYDIAWDPISETVFATGSSIPGDGEGAIPFVYAFDRTGNKRWTAYDWSRAQVAAEKLSASSVGLRLAVSKDGQLYVAGESRGGNTVWGRQSDALTTALVQPKADGFQSSYGIGGQHLTFIACLDARTGRSLQGTMLLGRAAKDRGSSMRPAALAVDAEGRIYVGGWAGATPPVSNGAIGLRGEGEGAFLCVFDQNFRRLYAARLCGGSVTAIATGPSAIAVAGQARDGLDTVAPLQAEPAGEDDGWLMLFRKRPANEYESPIFRLVRP